LLSRDLKNLAQLFILYTLEDLKLISFLYLTSKLLNKIGDVGSTSIEFCNMTSAIVQTDLIIFVLHA